MQITIKIDTSQITVNLQKVLDGLKDTSKLREGIGVYLLRTTKERIKSQGPAPDGESWQPLSSAYLRAKRQNNKDRGMLQYEGHLFETLSYQLTDDGVVVGTPQPYAAIHQFGGTIRKKASTKTIRLRQVKNKNNKTVTRFAKQSHKKARDLTVKVGEHKAKVAVGAESLVGHFVQKDLRRLSLLGYLPDLLKPQEVWINFLVSVDKKTGKRRRYSPLVIRHTAVTRINHPDYKV